MNIIKTLVLAARKRSRQKRAEMFHNHFKVDQNTKILDLGSENGSNINNILEGTNATPDNIYIADINEEVVNEGNLLFGYNPVFIEESKPLPYTDNFFDIVYCSSAIEHVTIPKEKVWSIVDDEEFNNTSNENQKKFAHEILRLGRQYFVQTPNKTFLIESHTWLPVVNWLPRWLLVPVLKMSNKVWVKKTEPDWRLLGKKELLALFGDATILEEKMFGLSKSIIALRTDKQ